MRILIMVGVLIFLTGCTKQVNRSSLQSVVVGGWNYSIPYGMHYASTPVNYKMAKKMNALGIPCKKRDIAWMSPSIKRNINARKSMNISSVYRRGLIGCSHPRNSSSSSTSRYQRKRIYTCSQLTRAQAYALLRAGHTYLDRDHDGHPCEWGRRKVRKQYYPSAYKSNCHYVHGYYRRSGTYVRGYTRCR